MLSLSQQRLKSDYESRSSEEKKVSERNKNLIVLIERFLLNLGYVDTVTKLQAESTISLDKWDAADNMDLYMIMAEYEQFYELKFARPPKMIVKKDGADDKALGRRNTTLPKLRTEKKEPQSQDSTTPGLPPRGVQAQGTGVKTKASSMGKTTPSNKDAKENGNGKEEGGFEITGNGITSQADKKTEDTEDFFQGRVLKGLPEFNNNPELRDLAMTLQRDICIENPNVNFSDVSGLERAKSLLKEAVLLPMKYPQLFTGILEPWRGVLLYGPPGTGKTMLAKAVASECKTTFFNISGSSIVSKWRGDSEKLVKVLFDLARHYQPSTIFIDEIDSIMSQRGGGGAEHEGSRRMKTELLIQMDGLARRKNERVFLLAASNLPWDLDAAMLRRLEKRILVPLPEEETRAIMFKALLPPDRTDNLDYDDIARKTEGYSGSDIKLVCKESAMRPLRRLLDELERNNSSTPSSVRDKKRNTMYIPNNQPIDITPEPVTEEDVLESLATTKPSPGMGRDTYEKWEKEFGSV